MERLLLESFAVIIALVIGSMTLLVRRVEEGSSFMKYVGSLFIFASIVYSGVAIVPSLPIRAAIPICGLLFVLLIFLYDIIVESPDKQILSFSRRIEDSIDTFAEAIQQRPFAIQVLKFIYSIVLALSLSVTYSIGVASVYGSPTITPSPSLTFVLLLIVLASVFSNKIRRSS